MTKSNTKAADRSNEPSPAPKEVLRIEFEWREREKD